MKKYFKQICWCCVPPSMRLEAKEPEEKQRLIQDNKSRHDSNSDTESIELVCYIKMTIANGAAWSLSLRPVKVVLIHEKRFGNTKRSYSMFHLTWTTFKFNRNQLATVSAYVM